MESQFIHIQYKRYNKTNTASDNGGECFWGGADSDEFMETHEQRSVGGQVRALS